MSTLTVLVKTGDHRGSGSNANVFIIIRDVKGNETSRIELNNMFKNDFERGKEDCFPLAEEQTRMLKDALSDLELQRDGSGLNSAWFLERVTIVVKEKKQQEEAGTSYVFPFNRWIEPNRSYKIPLLDTSLPQQERYPEQRKDYLAETRVDYRFLDEYPRRVAEVPKEEAFSDGYQLFIVGVHLELKATSLFKKMQLSLELWLRRMAAPIGLFSKRSISDFKDLYTSVNKPPDCFKQGYWDKDWWFGRQRLAGLDPHIIRLCQQIPANFAVNGKKLELDGMRLEDALAAKRIFICDLTVMNLLGATRNGLVVPSPYALFFLNNEKLLLPVAIQLFDQPRADNPVFYPSDDYYTWLLAKLWYNCAEANHHQSVTHLVYVHFLMESFCIAAHRELAGSHPIFRLLKPHFLFLLQINQVASNGLINDGGIIDRMMSIGARNVKVLGQKRFAAFRMDVEGTLPKFLESRGVLDENVLPDYPFRDDAILLYNEIETYVKEYVNLYYRDDSVVQEDPEIQAWVKVISAPVKQEGFGIFGMPLTDGRLATRAQLAQICTSVIYTCSVQHASVNFPMYDQSAFQPNYPPMLIGRPPNDIRTRTEADLMAVLPDDLTMIFQMEVLKVLSERSPGHISLGNGYESYIVDPKATEAGDRFRKRLKAVNETIERRNEVRRVRYDYLDPDLIPNSIAI